jgi:uncharacterized repeat protein (TIGR03803 family)
VFSVSLSGTETMMNYFSGNPGGSQPQGGVVLDSGTGLLYGTTEYGGTSRGTVFSLPTSCVAPCGSVSYYAFTGTPTDGIYPYSNLIDISGILYGTTVYGGNSTNCGANGCGTVFKITASGLTGEAVVNNFAGIPNTPPDGYEPMAGVLAVGTTLWGTTSLGGSQTNCGVTTGCGTVFSVP